MLTELEDQIEEVLITAEEIEERIVELGAEITADYEVDDDIVMVGILRGGIMFMSDLARHVDLPVTFDFMDVSSYDGTKSSGVVRIIKDLEENIEGRHVLIVEDIIDTGLTLKHVVDFLATRDPASIKICTLLDKPDRRTEKEVDMDYNGFEIPDKFVVGYGLDYNEKYRNVPYIFVLKPEVYE
ncbi:MULTISPECIES: hypoxanthine phosphoribosyltransferase [unclassified Candidatus Frackibacter]|uniref:hypoxanthine phosphoribosyltransferase n=1 Tax=unclassified Candidatus Frackibacter TaxID=2648818 RepID=UPI0007940262|nr:MULTISPECIES: hypoxanthine phosphoribosyltransferase [unclassified Candidatus Frackibacter]KXS45657.1 MAG: hypoxanthine phosphoribosyltransferase [Candidatus Frackibacter sp. T328-2]SDC67004.1 hypoxanthine phosphoribosyltransferase [Candidatus Frackibacter sp. WG11]SEM80244.1 hypoxanthine phosphoribosyltransferase [Candidatus Frackibacter sp. WG12]SFL90762.1 hypoxanthine phosphoribosyltransferase [Candidatus Frackibacter sp. WG13]